MRYSVCYADGGGFAFTLVAKSNINPLRFCGYCAFVNVRNKDIPYSEAKLTFSFGTVEAAWDSVVAGDWAKGDTIYGEKTCTT